MVYKFGFRGIEFLSNTGIKDCFSTAVACDCLSTCIISKELMMLRKFNVFHTFYIASALIV